MGEFAFRNWHLSEPVGVVSIMLHKFGIHGLLLVCKDLSKDFFGYEIISAAWHVQSKQIV